MSYDTDVRATYLQVSDRAVARTVDVSDLVMVDLDETGRVVGVEFAVALSGISDEMLDRLVEHFPELKVLNAQRDWLLTSA